MIKCPKCGYRLKRDGISNYEIVGMMENVDSNTKKLLKNIIQKIRKFVPSQNNRKLINEFISQSLKYDYKILQVAIQNYNKNAYVTEGKGFNYLLKMIDNYEKDFADMQKYEKNRFGTNPPIIIWDGTLEELK